MPPTQRLSQLLLKAACSTRARTRSRICGDVSLTHAKRQSGKPRESRAGRTRRTAARAGTALSACAAATAPAASDALANCGTAAGAACAELERATHTGARRVDTAQRRVGRRSEPAASAAMYATITESPKAQNVTVGVHMPSLINEHATQCTQLRHNIADSTRRPSQGRPR